MRWNARRNEEDKENAWVGNASEWETGMKQGGWVSMYWERPTFLYHEKKGRAGWRGQEEYVSGEWLGNENLEELKVGRQGRKKAYIFPWECGIRRTKGILGWGMFRNGKLRRSSEGGQTGMGEERYFFVMPSLHLQSLCIGLLYDLFCIFLSNSRSVRRMETVSLRKRREAYVTLLREKVRIEINLVWA